MVRKKKNSTFLSKYKSKSSDAACKQTFDLAGNTKIINLNIDCMEKIFEHLDLYDLLSVADSCKRFYDAACRVYKRKFSNMNPIFDDEFNW